MKLKIGKLILVCLGFYTLVDPLRSLLLNGYISFLNGINGVQSIYFMLNSFVSFLIYAISVYAACYFWYEAKQWWKIIMTLVLAFILSANLRYLLDQELATILFNATNYRPGVQFKYYLSDQFYFSILYFTLGFVFFVINNSRHRDQVQQSLIVQNQQMELSLLRAQINPHFLLNSMNNIYALVSMRSDNALDTIDKLSKILKYTLYENKEEVPLSKEVEYLHNYIDLQKIRLDYDPAIKMDINEGILNTTVPQFLLVPLIENAFKHGNLKDKNHPLALTIQQNKNDLIFQIANATGKHNKDDVGGIGLENVKRRLALLYPNNHTFEVQERDDQFTVNIKIPIK